MAEHTPGPWRWELNEKHRSVQLCGGDPKGGYGKFDETVMDFVRWGMSGATPRFIDKRTPITRLSRADKFGAVMDGREHHADWFKLVEHPDACLIEAAPDLLSVTKKLRTALDALRPFPLVVEPVAAALIAEADAAIAKAEPRTLRENADG